MEYMNFIHWCINQYIMMTDRVKHTIYRKNAQYTPALLDITLAQKCIFLTALINNVPFMREGKEEIYEQIKRGLEASYEKIKGTWKKQSKDCINTARLYVDENFSGDLFFLQLMIAADDLYYSGDAQIEWVEKNMINLPIERELGRNRLEQEVNAEDFLGKFANIIDKEKTIFYMRDEFGTERQWFDYMKIYNFYEYYWYLAE